jgi:hypothetical protein
MVDGKRQGLIMGGNTANEMVGSKIEWRRRKDAVSANSPAPKLRAVDVVLYLTYDTILGDGLRNVLSMPADAW